MKEIIKAEEYNYNSLKKYIEELNKEYSFTELFSIGKSCMGREIPAIKIGDGEYRLYTAGFSGTERFTTNVLLHFLEEICFSIKENIPFEGINLNKALKNRGIIIVPRVNPDGTEIALCGAAAAGGFAKEIRRISGENTHKWSANLRGVEINRNFSAGWSDLRKTCHAKGIIAPSLFGYMGIHPESEPETVSLINLLKRYYFKYSISLLKGDSVIYWKYGDKLPKNSEKIVSLLSSYSGFRAVEGSDSPGGSLKDYFINTYNLPAFNLHIDNTDIHTCSKAYSEIRKMLLVSLLL